MADILATDGTGRVVLRWTSKKGVQWSDFGGKREDDLDREDPFCTALREYREEGSLSECDFEFSVSSM